MIGELVQISLNENSLKSEIAFVDWRRLVAAFGGSFAIQKINRPEKIISANFSNEFGF